MEILEFFIFLSLLCMSAYFSATESAFFSISQLRLKKMADEGDNRAADILFVLKDKQRVLISLLLGNCIVNVSSTAIATTFILNFVAKSVWFGQSIFGNSTNVGIALASFIMTIVLLLFGEIVPKTIAIFNAVRFARMAVVPLKFLLL
ncbi:DUF21 domain-containing protein, partial [bacterium]|nr:DUF21 domain-containing protein [bacterium]